MHLLYLMTRWALVADVWYLPPRPIASGQSPIDFANAVKAEISKRAELRNLSMDGYFKVFVLCDTVYVSGISLTIHRILRRLKTNKFVSERIPKRATEPCLRIA